MKSDNPTQPNTPESDTGLREKLIEKYMKVAESFYYEGSYEKDEREKYAPEFANDIMALIRKDKETIAREARIDELKELQIASNVSDNAKDENWNGYIQARLAALNQEKQKGGEDE